MIYIIYVRLPTKQKRMRWLQWICSQWKSTIINLNQNILISGKRSSRAHLGCDVMAALWRFRTQPRFRRRWDLAWQADSIAAHVWLVPIVPRDFTRRAVRFTRLIQRAVAGAPWRLGLPTAPTNITILILSLLIRVANVVDEAIRHFVPYQIIKQYTKCLYPLIKQYLAII